MPATAAALAAASGAAQAGAGLLGNVIGAYTTGRANKKNREFQEHMYNRQREDSLADWNMQNEYNSPKAQMQRLQDANLNPDLIYGGGGFTEAAGVPRSASAVQGQHQAFKPDTSFVGEALMNYYNIKQSNAQTDNLAANNTVITMDALLKASQVLNTNASTASITGDTAMKQFNLDQAQKLQPYVIELAKKQVQKTDADIDYTLSNTEVQRALANTSIQKAAEEILSMRMQRAVSKEDIERIKAQVRLINSDDRIRQLDIELRRNGIMPGDSLGMRVIGRLIGPDFIQNIKDKTKDIKMALPWNTSERQQSIRDSIFNRYEQHFRR